MSAEADFSNWIGHTETAAADVISERLIQSFRAMLSPHLAEAPVPPGIHWCLSPAIRPAAELGPDGHPAKGGFLPPVPLPRRMWAGGELEFLANLHLGDVVTRHSTIRDISHKEGRSGALCFVTVEHQHMNADGVPLIRERQDIVYRPAATGPAPSPAPDERQGFTCEWAIDIDTVLLFRYAALTFNGHRIHYDEPYARNVEFYPGLVIQGPLQATLLLNLAAAQVGSLPRRFTFRGTSPGCGAQTLRARAWTTEQGFDLAMVSQSGVTTMTAHAEW